MGDYGIKVSQGGFDALTDPDYKMVFNSAWPLLNIVKQGEVSVPDFTVGLTTLYTHDLGYIPMFLIWDLDASNNWTLANNDLYGIRATSTGLISLGGASTALIRYMIFDRDMTVDFEASNIYTTIDPSSAIRDPDYGIKVTKEGADTSSTDFRDYVIHSGCRSPIIHSVNSYPEASGARTYTITHNMGKAPMAFAYLRTTAQPTRLMFCDISPESGSGVELSASSTTVTASITQGGQLTIVVLKDPIFIE